MKRFADILAGLIGLFVLSPVFVIITLMIRLKMGSPVLFRQARPGLHGKEFQMVKFRTMSDAVDRDGNLLPDTDRLTPLGRFLRSSSLDELPELWNVIKGDMSLVGPRPLLTEYLSLYSVAEARRHEVRPGITGWAQINGRNNISWEEKFALDLWYVNNRSFMLDLKIVIITVMKVIKREGVSAKGEATVKRFEGSQNVSPDHWDG